MTQRVSAERPCRTDPTTGSEIRDQLRTVARASRGHLHAVGVSHRHLVVSGYVRSTKPRPGRIAHCRGLLGEYCSSHDFYLNDVYVDSGVDAADLVRPAFTRLLDDLGAGDIHGVLVPGLHHLSWYTDVAAELCAQIFRTGAHLIMMDLTAPQL